ncbi:hypothetical protein, conserved [Eimeria praecox]|uniref:Transmembrane protein n=1 Tax=Eimeria praecox TaxID=51316 RepID=U6H777_9EIME|nr:hypothetical protein, conserved [Eimeria praecox]
MRRSVSLAIVSLGVLVAFSNQLGTAEASLSASQASLTHDEVQVRDESVFAREASLKAFGKRVRTVALVSLIAIAAALVFAVYKCFRGLESRRAVGGQRVAARRLAEGDDSDGEGAAAPGDDDECAPNFGFYGGIPVKYGPDRGLEDLLVKIVGGKFYLNHPTTGQCVPLIVKWLPGVGPMLHEASTGYDLEWVLYNPNKLKWQDEPAIGEWEDVWIDEGAFGGESFEEVDFGEASSSSSEEDEAEAGEAEASEAEPPAEGDEGLTGSDAEEVPPHAEPIVYKPEEPEWRPPPSPEYPYVIFVSGMPVRLNSVTGAFEEILLKVQRGEFLFMHPTLGQPWRVTFREGDLYSAEDLSLRGVIEELKKQGPPPE